MWFDIDCIFIVDDIKMFDCLSPAIAIFNIGITEFVRKQDVAKVLKATKHCIILLIANG